MSPIQFFFPREIGLVSRSFTRMLIQELNRMIAISVTFDCSILCIPSFVLVCEKVCKSTCFQVIPSIKKTIVL